MFVYLFNEHGIKNYSKYTQEDFKMQFKLSAFNLQMYELSPLKRLTLSL